MTGTVNRRLVVISRQFGESAAVKAHGAIVVLQGARDTGGGVTNQCPAFLAKIHVLQRLPLATRLALVKNTHRESDCDEVHGSILSFQFPFYNTADYSLPHFLGLWIGVMMTLFVQAVVIVNIRTDGEHNENDK